MSLLTEDVKTVIACQSLSAQILKVNELSTNTMVCDTLATHVLVVADPADANSSSTLYQTGDTLNMESTNPLVPLNVTIKGSVTVTGSMVVQTGAEF